MNMPQELEFGLGEKWGVGGTDKVKEMPSIWACWFLWENRLPLMSLRRLKVI